jgi:hypothetical protein
MNAEQLKGWIPARVYWQDAAPVLDWCYLGERRLTAPFFDQTVEECLRHPFNLLFRHQTPIAVLAAPHFRRTALAPGGFIFHTSRCGSTLISQMLAALPQNIVISEARPIDSILRANLRDATVTDEQRAEWLRWIVGALGQQRTGEEKRLFIKFDCWSAFDLPLIEKAFPEVPRLFVYREPSEVLVSQLRRRGAHMVPGVLEPALLGLDDKAVTQMPTEEYCARVLAKICDAALKSFRLESTLLVNYRQLPDAVCSTIAEFFGVEYTRDERAHMLHAAQFDAKNPSMNFLSDTDQKKLEASEPVREATEKWVTPLYEQLEKLRLS